MGGYNDPKGPAQGSGDDITKVGALADGFANTATNSTEVDDGATGYVGAANGDNRNNADNSTDVDVTADLDLKNGDNRDNSYDWDYNSTIDTDIKTTNINDADTTTSTKSDYDWSYEAKSDSHNISDSNNKADSHDVSDSFNKTDTDIKTVTDTDIKSTTDIKTSTETDSSTTSDSFNKIDTSFANLDAVHDFGNLGIAGGDLTFNLGDDFSFNLDVDNILNNSLNGDGTDTGFSVVQANHLADQDTAYNMTMDNAGTQNQLSANGGTAHGADGADMDGKGWDLQTGDDFAGTSTADASALLGNSGVHMEVVQGANMLSNTLDSSVIGQDSSVSTIGQDSDAA